MTKGEKIKAARETAGLTQEELGRLCGTTKQTIYKYEMGKVTNIPLERIEAIAKAVGVTPAYLMDWEEYAHDTSLPDNAIPVDFSTLKRIPILGQISAGLPLYAEQNIEGYTYTDLNHGGEYFALRVRGDSMNAARIYENDLLIVRKQDTAEDGEIVVAMVGDDEATVKYWHRRGNVVMLEPKSTNPIHQMQIYDLSETKIRIIGKVVQNQISY